MGQIITTEVCGNNIYWNAYSLQYSFAVYKKKQGIKTTYIGPVGFRVSI